MLFALKVKYNGQEHIFEDIEIDDEQLRDESYGPGEAYNNEVVIEDLQENAEYEVLRRSDPPDNRDAMERRQDYLADQADNRRKYGRNA